MKPFLSVFQWIWKRFWMQRSHQFGQGHNKSESISPKSTAGQCFICFSFRVTSSMSVVLMCQLIIAFGICELRIQKIKPIGLTYCNRIKCQWASIWQRWCAMEAQYLYNQIPYFSISKRVTVVWGRKLAKSKHLETFCLGKSILCNGNLPRCSNQSRCFLIIHWIYALQLLWCGEKEWESTERFECYRLKS